jgi:hypothetical protein
MIRCHIGRPASIADFRSDSLLRCQISLKLASKGLIQPIEFIRRIRIRTEFFKLNGGATTRPVSNFRSDKPLNGRLREHIITSMHAEQYAISRTNSFSCGNIRLLTTVKTCTPSSIDMKFGKINNGGDFSKSVKFG